MMWLTSDHMRGMAATLTAPNVIASPMSLLRPALESRADRPHPQRSGRCVCRTGGPAPGRTRPRDADRATHRPLDGGLRRSDRRVRRGRCVPSRAPCRRRAAGNSKHHRSR
jgi:hypothetical protein